MQREKQLSELYSSYTEGEIPKKEFEGEVFKYLLNNFKRYHVFDGNRGKWEEFLGWFYSRLSRAIDHYRDIGATFDGYITSYIQGAVKEYRCREAEHYVTEFACWQAKAEETLTYEYEHEKPEKPEKVSIPKDINPKQLLFLLLKSYYSVTEEIVERTASTIGIKSEILWDLIEKLKTLCSEKELGMLKLRERIHCQHYRCLVYQKRMNNAQKGTLYHDKLKVRFEHARKRFYSMKKRLCGIRMTASNRMIADVLGIPKGTVDSGLYMMKKYMALKGKKAV